jgi:hypothetical protein
MFVYHMLSNEEDEEQQSFGLPSRARLMQNVAIYGELGFKEYRRAELMR